MAYVYPGVKPVKVVGILRGWLVFVNKNWWVLPLVDCLAHTVPICAATLGKNDNDWTPLICDIRSAIRRFGTNVIAIGLLERLKRRSEERRVGKECRSRG